VPFEFEEILDTVRMTETEHFDIRTVTLGISLRDCRDRDINVTKSHIYEKICRVGEHHVEYAQEIERMYGISIANKRVSLTPISIACDGFEPDEYFEIGRTLDRAADTIGIDFIGGFGALVQKGWTKGEFNLIDSIPRTLSETKHVVSSVNVASTKAGINMDALVKMAQVIKDAARLSAEQDSLACGKLVVFCNVPEDNPFVAGAFHGVTEPEVVLNVGISGPGVVLEAVKEAGNCSMDELAEVIKKTAYKITRAGALIGKKVAEKHSVPFGIVDLSLAPTPAIGDSIADILEAMGLEHVGAPGTTAALAMLNDAVKKGGLMASNHVGGMSGAFIPVSEDTSMAKAAADGHLSLEKLEAMTCVCSVGLDMVVVPGDTSVDVLAGIIADECAIGMVNDKTTAVRIIPAYGKGVGDVVDWGGLLGKAEVMAIRTISPAKFVNRGGRFPAPMRSLTN